MIAVMNHKITTQDKRLLASLALYEKIEHERKLLYFINRLPCDKRHHFNAMLKLS